MSTPNEFRALLLAAPAVVALVGPRGVGLHEVPPGTPAPYIIFSATADPEPLLAGPEEGEPRTTLQCACWAPKAHQADALATAVEQACEAFDLTSTSAAVTVQHREPEYDPDLQLDCVVLTIEWWP